LLAAQNAAYRLTWVIFFSFRLNQNLPDGANEFQ